MNFKEIFNNPALKDSETLRTEASKILEKHPEYKSVAAVTAFMYDAEGRLYFLGEELTTKKELKLSGGLEKWFAGFTVLAGLLAAIGAFLSGLGAMGIILPGCTDPAEKEKVTVNLDVKSVR